MKVLWDEAIGPDEYLRVAEELSGGTWKQQWKEESYREVRRALRSDGHVYEQLGDRRNWLVERPKVVVVGEVNQRGNFSAKWLPASGYGSMDLTTWNEAQFEVGFLRACMSEAYGNYRPRNELLRIRDCPMVFDRFDKPDGAVVAVAFAAWAAYMASVRRVAEIVELVDYMPLVVSMDRHNLPRAEFGPRRPWVYGTSTVADGA